MYLILLEKQETKINNMKKIIKKLYITLGNYKYQIRFLTSGKMYITRLFTHKGFEKFMTGKIKLGSGII